LTLASRRSQPGIRPSDDAGLGRAGVGPGKPEPRATEPAARITVDEAPGVPDPAIFDVSEITIETALSDVSTIDMDPGCWAVIVCLFFSSPWGLGLATEMVLRHASRASRGTQLSGTEGTSRYLASAGFRGDLSGNLGRRLRGLFGRGNLCEWLHRPVEGIGRVGLPRQVPAAPFLARAWVVPS
jgi:hypothetical protein